MPSLVRGKLRACRSAIESAVARVKEAEKSNDAAAIKSAVEGLEQATHALSKHMYDAAQAAGFARLKLNCVIQRGTNHGWVNEGSVPCRLAVVLLDGNPKRSGSVAGSSNAR